MTDADLLSLHSRLLAHLHAGDVLERELRTVLAARPSLQMAWLVDWPTRTEPPYNEKIHTIKEVRALTRMGLKEAKDLVEATSPTSPQPLCVAEEADVALLRAMGATVVFRDGPWPRSPQGDLLLLR